jgi:hypothetical protein
MSRIWLIDTAFLVIGSAASFCDSYGMTNFVDKLGAKCDENKLFFRHEFTLVFWLFWS